MVFRMNDMTCLIKGHPVGRVYGSGSSFGAVEVRETVWVSQDLYPRVGLAWAGNIQWLEVQSIVVCARTGILMGVQVGTSTVPPVERVEEAIHCVRVVATEVVVVGAGKTGEVEGSVERHRCGMCWREGWEL